MVRGIARQQSYRGTVYGHPGVEAVAGLLEELVKQLQKQFLGG
jgi:hypothetical protein